jgi:hypothetical protein
VPAGQVREALAIRLPRAESGERQAPKARAVWDRAAVRIEHYRNSFEVSDPRSALGDRPDELRAPRRP